MTTPSIRYGGGVWRQQAERVKELELQLVGMQDERDSLRTLLAEWKAGYAEVQLENGLLREELTQLTEACEHQAASKVALQALLCALEVQLRRTAESRAMGEEDNVVWRGRWIDAQQTIANTQEILAKQDLALSVTLEECDRLRDMLYASQEQGEYQMMELVRQTAELRVLHRSQLTKVRQLELLSKEKDTLARKLAETRCLPVGQHDQGKALKTPKPQDRHVVASSPIASPLRVSSVVSVPNHTISASSVRKQLLQREREKNEALERRIQSLERSQQEWIVRFREATKAKRPEKRHELKRAPTTHASTRAA